MSHLCTRCQRTFAHKSSLSRHKKSCKGVPKRVAGAGGGFKCNDCDKVFARKNTLKQHQAMAHGEMLMYQCGLCSAFFSTRSDVEEHRQTNHRNRSMFVLRQSAHGKSIESFRLYLPERFTTNFSACIDYCMEKAEELLKHVLVDKRHAKVGLNLSLRFAKPQFNKGGGTEQDGFGIEEREVMTYNIRPTSRVYMYGDQGANRRRLADSFAEIGERFGDFNHRGSGWILVDCLYFDVDVGQCLSMQGSCSIHSLSSKDGVVWVNKEGQGDNRGDFGNRCFYHAVACFLLTNHKRNAGNLFPMQHTEAELEMFVRSHINEVVPTPVPLSKVSEVEKANENLDLAINVVYRADDKDIYPAYASPNIRASNQVVLMLFHRDLATDTELTEEQKRRLHQDVLADYGDDASAVLSTPQGMQAVMHYAPLFDVSRVFAKRVVAYGTAVQHVTHTRPRFHCFNCFMAFQSQSALEAHVVYCHNEKGQVYVVPEKGETIKFVRKRKSFKLGYIFFFDFETLQVRDLTVRLQENNPNRS